MIHLRQTSLQQVFVKVLGIVFTNSSTGGSGTVTHAWTFGDGGTSSAA